MVLTVGGALTHGSAELAGPGVPRADLDLDAVLGQDLQVGQNHPVLLDVADAPGLQGATERLPTMQRGETRTGHRFWSSNVRSA